MSTPVATGALRVRVGWAAALLLITALEFTAVYDGVAAPLTLLLAVVMPFAIVWGGTALRWGSSWPALATIVVAAGIAGLVLGGSVADTLPRLLTSARPTEASASLLAPTVVVVVLVSALVAACVFAPESAVDGRVAGLLAPVLGSAVLYTAAQVLSAGASDPQGIVAMSVVVVVVAGWSTPYLRGGGRAAWRPVAVLPVLVSVLFAVAVATLVPGGAFDPRRHVTPPTVRLTAVSPLTQLASWNANPSVEIFRAHVTGTDRLHLATLSRFTGADWRVDERYREVGLAGTPDLPVGTRRAEVRATVKVTRIGGVWVPSAGTVDSTTLSGALVDSDDGTLARTSGVRPGEQYDLRARIDAPTDTRLAAAGVPQDVPERYLELPNAPIGFAQYSRAAIRGASTALEEAVAIEHAVATNRTLSPTAPSGSSYGRLQSFLFTPKGPAGAQVGTAEQFAAAFAVLAREVGLPTRLVVGFTLPTPNVNGTSVVRGQDATVWPEVYFQGSGWVPFSPTPDAGGDAAESDLRDTVLQRLADHAKDPLPVQPPIKASGTAGPTAPVRPGTPAAGSAAPAAGLSTGVIVGIAVGGVVVALLAALLGLRARRAARHRRSGPQGVWAEFTDLLVLLGRRPAPSAAAPHVAAEFDADYPHPGARAGVLALAAERAAFAPGVAGPGGPAARAGSPELWRDLRVLRRRARSTVPRMRRALWPLDPRPLLQRRR